MSSFGEIVSLRFVTNRCQLIGSLNLGCHLGIERLAGTIGAVDMVGAPHSSGQQRSAGAAHQDHHTGEETEPARENCE